MALRFDPQAKYAVAVVCLVMLASSAGFRVAISKLNVYLEKEPVTLRGPLATISKSLGRWKAVGVDRTLDEAMIEELGTRFYLDRTYAIDGRNDKGVMNIHVAYYSGMIDAVPHVPDRCLVAAGYHAMSLPRNYHLDVNKEEWKTDAEYENLATGNPYSIVTIRHEFTGQFIPIRMPVGDLALRTTVFEEQGQRSSRIFAGYFFIANGRATATPEGVRVMAFNPSERHAYYCKVQFTYATPGATTDRFLAAVSEIVKDFLPELMRRLPDWAEVERHKLQPSTTPVASLES